MASSERLRVRDVRAIYLLLGECCELGGDSLVWRAHMLRQLARILGAQIAICGTVLPSSKGSAIDLVPESFLDYGWTTEQDRNLYLRWLEEKPQSIDPLLVYLSESVPHRRASLTCSRRSVLKEDLWYNSHFYGEFYRPTRLDDELQSFFWRPHSQCIDGLSFIRPADAEPFDVRQHRLLRLFHAEACRLLGTKLANPTEPSIAALSPRLRQVLACLLEGDSEKQIALRLGISRHTVHEHVKRLHLHFAVASRGELMSRCLRLYPALQQLELLDPFRADYSGARAFGEAFRW